MAALNLARVEALAASFALLMLIGLGPTLHLLSLSRQKLMYTLFLAPTVGFGILGLILYPVILSDHPLGPVTVPITWICIAASLILTTLDVRRNYYKYCQYLEYRTLIRALLLFSITFVVLILPMWSDTIDHSF